MVLVEILKELIKQYHNVPFLDENSFSFKDLVFAIDEGVAVNVGDVIMIIK